MKSGVLPPEQEPPTIESAPTGGNTQSSNISTPASGNEGDPLSFSRTQPQFQQMRQVIQQNPQLSNAILQQIGQSNPQLLQLISQNQESFVRMLNEPPASQGSKPSQGSGGGAATGTGTGSFPMEATITTQVSPQDREAIERENEILKRENQDLKEEIVYLKQSLSEMTEKFLESRKVLMDYRRPELYKKVHERDGELKRKRKIVDYVPPPCMHCQSATGEIQIVVNNKAAFFCSEDCITSFKSARSVKDC